METPDTDGGGPDAPRGAPGAASDRGPNGGGASDPAPPSTDEILAKEADRFPALARRVLVYQWAHNPVYRRYCKAMGVDLGATAAGPKRTADRYSDDRVRDRTWERAPFLPVEAFKHAPVTCFPPEEAERVFVSSGTGTGTRSRHHVRDLGLYERSAARGFARVFGDGPFTVLAHLPGYAERGGRSSLVHMARMLIDRFGDPWSGLFLDDRAPLEEGVACNRDRGYPLVLLGAAFGLLDLLEEGAPVLPEGAAVIETGGMKTHRRAIERSELHRVLARGFGIPRERVFSEYGMCELLSQCYTRGDRIFRPPPWMRLRVVDPERPERTRPSGRAGALAVFDLANVHTASPLLTADRAVRRAEGVEILGRLPSAELRGCNFLVEDDE